LRGKDKETLIQDLLVGQYEKYYRMAYSYVHSESDAQDIVQEAAYKSIYHAKKLKDPDFADTWICRIVINEAMNYIKKNKKTYVELEEVDVGREEVYEDVDLRAAIDRLSPKDKTIIVLRFFEDMSLEQIAEICDENVNTIKSRLYRTLKKLKIDLQEEGIVYG
jgi:RNA polymerase sigma-70 factor (ECF subfamily)